MDEICCVNWFRSYMISSNDAGSTWGPDAFCTLKKYRHQQQDIYTHIHIHIHICLLSSLQCSGNTLATHVGNILASFISLLFNDLMLMSRVQGCQLLEKINWISTCSKPWGQCGHNNVNVGIQHSFIPLAFKFHFRSTNLQIYLHSNFELKYL